MANDKTPNYHWDIPNPYGLQIVEMIKVASTFGAIDSQIKACADAIQSHKHSFQDITNRPTTLNGYGITDAITTEQVRSEIETSQAAQQSVIDQSISNLASSTAAALDVRLRFDAQQAIPLIQRARARANINALGIEDKGAPNGVATLDAGGKIPSSQLPPIAITDTFVVNSQASMLALIAERGDVAVRTDLNKSFILRLEPATVFANWQEILTPADGVLSVNGEAGPAVNLTASHINLGNVANKSEAQMVASGAIADALEGKLPSNAQAADSARLGNKTAVQWQTEVDDLKKQFFGNGQVWQSVSRPANTVFQNTTGRTIFITVNISSGYGTFQMSPDNVNWSTASEIGGGQMWVMGMPIPNGYYYKTTTGGSYRELR